MFTDKRCTAAHILIFFVLNVFNFRKSSATWMDLRTMDYMQSSMDSTKPGISEAMDGIWYDDHWYKNVRGYEGTRKWHASLCNVEKAEDCTKCAYLAANDTDGWFAVSLGSPTDILAVDILGRRDKRSKANLNGLAVYTTNLTKDQLTPVLNKQDYAALQQCGDQLATGNRFQTFRCERFGVRWVIIRVAQAHAAICEVGVVNTGWLDLKDKELLRSHRTYPIFDAHIAVLGGGNWLPNTRGFRLPCRDKPRYWAVNLGELTDIVQVAAMTRDRLPERLARTKVYTGGDLPTEEVKKMLNNKDYRSFKLCQQIPKNLERNRWNNLVCPTPSVKWVILHWLNPCGSVVEVGVRQAAFDECLHNFCLNNATCTDLTPGFSCTCQPGFTGIYCQIDINECEPNPCLNGGRCQDFVDGYQCHCVPGFQGRDCETNFDECLSYPCVPPGECIDGVNSYSCNCPSTTTGDKCEREIVTDFIVDGNFVLMELPSTDYRNPNSEAYKSLHEDISNFLWEQCHKAYQPDFKCEVQDVSFTPTGDDLLCEFVLKVSVSPGQPQTGTNEAVASRRKVRQVAGRNELVLADQKVRQVPGSIDGEDLASRKVRQVASASMMDGFDTKALEDQIKSNAGELGTGSLDTSSVNTGLGGSSRSSSAQSASQGDSPSINTNFGGASGSAGSRAQELPTFDSNKLAKKIQDNAAMLETGQVDPASVVVEPSLLGGKTEIAPNTNFIALGCFAYLPFHFTEVYQQLPFTTETSKQRWTNHTCSNRCRELHSYTYAAIHKGRKGRKKCKCFNDLSLLKFMNDTEKTGCSNIARERKVRYLEVFTTCPQGYYNPPMCNIRAKPTCLERSHHAVALFDGTCENCKQLKGETGWKGCHHIHNQDSPKIIDFRYMTAKSPVQPLTREDASSPVSAIGLTLSTVRPNEYYTDNRVQVFVHRIRAMLLARGACYFSTWSRTSNNRVALRDKILMNTDEDYKVVEFHNVNMHLAYPYNDDLAVHTIDIEKALGSDVEAAEYQGIVAKTMMSKADDFTASFSNTETMDAPQGSGAWRQGTELSINQCGGAEECSQGNKLFTSISLVAELVNTCPQMCERDECNEDLSCSHGCKSGYYGAHCDQLCSATTFGPSCDTLCSLGCVDEKCDSMTGVCEGGCVEGYSGVYCDVTCPAGLYGVGCTGVCSEHCDGTTCNMKTGHCDGSCQVGYQPPMCDHPCNWRSWGFMCDFTCGNCADNTTCNATTGECDDGCQDGFRMPDCVCSNTMWGPNCTKQCGDCKDKQPCHPVTGNCPSPEGLPGEDDDDSGDDDDGDEPQDPTEICDNAKQPLKCLCDYGKFGPMCDQSCGNCVKGYCDDTNGTCTLGCLPGFTGAACTETCENGRYGQDCSCMCPACDQPCFPTNGTCPGDTCRENFQPPNCRHCVPGRYGENCEKECGECEESRPCNRDGSCPSSSKDQVDWGTLQDIFMLSFSSEEPVVEMEVCHRADTNKASSAGGSGDSDGRPTELSDPPAEGGMTGEESHDQEKCQEMLEHEKHSLADLVMLIECGELASKPISDDEHGAVEDAVNSVCRDGFQGLHCKCSVGYWGEECSRPCGHCMAGCLQSNGACIGGCAPGWQGTGCNKPCELKFFGPNCEFECGKCSGTGGCHASNGTCVDDCQAGYMPPYCKCALGFFGDECEQECGHCAGDTCSFFDGTCSKDSGCEEPYSGPYCNCTVGMYGIDCNKRCGNCSNNELCRYTDGECEHGCEPGLVAPMCVETCPRGWWGPACGQECGSCRSCAPCDPVDGSCPGELCEQGYLPPKCKHWCEGNFYGENCSQPCGNCLNQQRCDPSDGFCNSGCEAGYKPPLCLKACDDNTYGFNCKESCGECLGGESCDPFSGLCTACKIYYSGPYCKEYNPPGTTTPKVECARYTFGPPACNNTCGNCLGGAPCDPDTGYCSDGCDPGYDLQVIYCNVSCDDKHYGENCVKPCGECRDGKPCDKITGKCEACADGYGGEKCKSSYRARYEPLHRRFRLSGAVSVSPQLYVCLLLAGFSCVVLDIIIM